MSEPVTVDFSEADSVSEPVPMNRAVPMPMERVQAGLAFTPYPVIVTSLGIGVAVGFLAAIAILKVAKR